MNDKTTEGSPEYEIKQILPLIKDKNFNEDFLSYDELKIRCKYNYALLNNSSSKYGPLFDVDGQETNGVIPLGNNWKPLEFWIDLGIDVNNIIAISFHPAVISSYSPNYFNNCCSVKDYEIYVSNDDLNYKLLSKNTYDISKGKDEKYIFLFKPEEITFNPIIFRYLKIKILNYYFTKIQGYDDGNIGFAKLRIYTNTKNLYNKEKDQSISNYKDDSFNQVTTKSEWDQKSKEDKIILNKQASFDNPSISKIKNELNDFRIITNHNNIPIYEKT